MRKLFFTILVLLACVSTHAVGLCTVDKDAAKQKLSMYLRNRDKMLRSKKIVAEARGSRTADTGDEDTPDSTITFLKADGDIKELVERYNGRLYAQLGDIGIIRISFEDMEAMAYDSQLKRLETRPSRLSCTLDTTGIITSSNRLKYMETAQGKNALQQTFTGKNVVVGMVDVGFDITHPNFLTRDLSELRIKRIWDMQDFSTDSPSHLPIGNEYEGAEDLLKHAHSADGLIHTHGTHTAGIAAGSGYDTQYVGMAPEADLCLVANLCDITDKLLPGKYWEYATSASDALAFWYICNYADSQGKPCVVSMSEGSDMWLQEDELLFQEFISRLSTPGHIIVTSAGNDGRIKKFMHKEAGKDDAIACFKTNNGESYFGVYCDGNVNIDLTFNKSGIKNTISIPLDYNPVTQQSEWIDVINGGMMMENIFGAYWLFMVYPFSCSEMGGKVYYNIVAYNLNTDYADVDIVIKDMDKPVNVDFYSYDNSMMGSPRNRYRCDADNSHTMNSPAWMKDVIAVGATTWRSDRYNYKGVHDVFIDGEYGKITDWSSRGPGIDGNTKPNIAAPGMLIISSYSSYYEEANPNAGDINSDRAHFDYNGRSYAWNYNSGTSMATPVVSGIIAQWLEAIPTLTTEDVLNAFSATATHNDETLSYPNNVYGYGEINAYHGLLHLLGFDNIPGVSTKEEMSVTTRMTEGGISIDFESAPQHPVTVSAYTPSGTLIARKSVTEQHDILPLNGACESKVIVVQVGDKGSKMVRM